LEKGGFLVKKKKEEKPVVDPYRYSPKVTLHPGDIIKVTGGPYYMSKTGKKILLGKRGLFVFDEGDKEGIFAHPYKPHSELPQAKVFIYLGAEKISESTGTHFSPHKIKKPRNYPGKLNL
jgi:hypothetical protein